MSKISTKKVFLKKIIISIVALELIVILSLTFAIFKKIESTNVTNLPKSQIQLNPSEDLKYFFEPIPSASADKPPNFLYEGININSDTLNERYDYQTQKPTNTYRIIVLGDSFAFGLFVKTENNWAELLENRLKTTCHNNVEVINLSVPGYDTRYELERFIKRGIKYDPALIIWSIVDMARITEEIMPLIQNRSNQNKTDSLENFSYARNIVLKKYLTNSIVQHQISSLKEIFKYYNQKVVLFVEPVTVHKKEKALIKKMADEDNRFIYFEPKDSPLNDKQKVIPGDIHPNELGHLLIAQEIYEYLIESQLLPCQNK